MYSDTINKVKPTNPKTLKPFSNSSQYQILTKSSEMNDEIINKQLKALNTISPVSNLIYFARGKAI